ncbi:MAG TPA: DUF1549 domain-containing protein [Pirellulales bacterium]|nr:DUF1549 domain-containing protein [Pirellulales bacterium]
MSLLRFAMIAAALLGFTQHGAGAGLEPQSVARHADELLSKEMFGAVEGAAHDVTARADDQTYLRRLSLDLTGHPPTPEEITIFALDGSPNKRSKAVERLLANPQFGENWARYWRDVILYRRSEDRALLVGPTVVAMLSAAFNRDPHWDKITRKFITATGDVREQGATAVIMAQMGNTEDTTAEVSRIFMGIQIQCAQCHHHPTDRWKREQFHQLAAFFPRIAVRPVKQGEERSFAVVSLNRERENPKKLATGGGHLEHHMPDLNHPDEEGKLMRPVFFVTGQKLDVGTPDRERREKLAEWLTGSGNHWFAKAFVNRIWSELVGHGFYEPIDDLGPDRTCSAPHTLDYLAEQFATSHYDVKWLFRVIADTEAYQRQSRSRYQADEAPLAANCPQRLRGDQLFNSLVEVLEIDESAEQPNRDNFRAALAGPRGRLNATFGYDPSERRDEVAGSIPQALFLMNAPVVNRALVGQQPNSALGKLLAKVPDDKAMVEELYLRCLAREPKQTELQTCLNHVRATGRRAEAFEDILWSLINSTEFLNRK